MEVDWDMRAGVVAQFWLRQAGQSIQQVPGMTPQRGLHRALAAGAVLLLLALAAGTALQLHWTYDAAMRSAREQLANTALITEHTVNRQLLQVDSALARLPAVLADAGDGATDQQVAARILHSFYFENFSFRDVLLVLPNGGVWATARPRPLGQPLPFALPEQVKAAPGVVSLEGPVLNPSTGAWSWYLLRSFDLSGPGRLVAAAEVPVPFITDLLSPIGAIPGVRIAVVRPDGMLLSSYPQDERSFGRPLAPPLPLSQPTGTSFDINASAARPAMIGVWRRTLYPDVAIALTQDLDDAIDDWLQERWRLILQNGLTGLLVVVIAASLELAMRQRERLERERRRSRDMLDSAIEAMSDGFVMWDENDCLVACNRRYRDFYQISDPFIRPGVHFEDIIRQGARLGQYPEAGHDIEAFVQNIVQWHRGDNPAIERLLPDGRWLQIKEHPIPTGGIVGIRTDITAMKQTLSELALANQRVSGAMSELRTQHEALVERDETLRSQNVLFDAALNNMSQGLLMVDADGRLIVCNQRFVDMFRVDGGAVARGTSIAAVFDAIVTAAALSPGAMAHMSASQQGLAVERKSGEFTIKDGSRLALSVSQRPLPEGGWVATYEDVTEHHLAEERVRFLAHHDPLTRLPNRTLFRGRMEEALLRVAKSGESMMVLYFDLDKFKYVNDTLGHPAGDALLEAVASRLAVCLRETDTVARLGGDEFAAIVISDDLESITVPLARRVIQALSSPYNVNGRQLEVGVSLGIAMTDGLEVDGDTLLKRADMALYWAKANNPGDYCIFEREMEDSLRSRLAIEADLKRALVTEQLEAFYQPIFNTVTGHLWGFEALIRWHHPTLGLVSPIEFVPLAEETGLIKSVGAWLVRRVCADMAQIPSPLKIAVNLSPRQLEDDELIEDITEALNSSGMDAGRFEFEITESTLLNNNTRSRFILLALRRMGATIALDDFGTGYSPLTYLTRFPLDKLKIDRSFISQMATRQDAAAIVRTIVQLAHQLHMTTTAEGVETEEQLQLIRKAGCTNVQGYLLGQPMALGDVVNRIGPEHILPATSWSATHPGNDATSSHEFAD